MCGRFTMQLTADEIHDLYGATQPTLALELPLRYNGGTDGAACSMPP